MRDVSFIKPRGMEDYFTITELSRKIDRDVSWIRKLERRGTIPVAKRVPHGNLRVRLWSPFQAEEIQRIVETIRPGRPRNA
jgi:hypothetical protein